MLLGAILQVELGEDLVGGLGRDTGLLNFLLHSFGEELVIGILQNKADGLSDFYNSLFDHAASE
jgi:hypothetical protein